MLIFKVRVLLSLVMLVLAAPLAARADTVLYDQASFISGSQSSVNELTIPAAGTLTITLTNVAWPAKLSDLSFLLTTSREVVEGITGEIANSFADGSEVLSFAVDEGKFFAHVFGTAQGPLNLGVYGLKVEFAPLAAVPLPAAGLLFASGLGLLWSRRRRVLA